MKNYIKIFNNLIWKRSVIKEKTSLVPVDCIVQATEQVDEKYKYLLNIIQELRKEQQLQYSRQNNKIDEINEKLEKKINNNENIKIELINGFNLLKNEFSDLNAKIKNAENLTKNINNVKEKIASDIPDIKNNRQISVKIISVHDLGLAWAGSTVNTVIFRHHGIITSGKYQFTAFYVNNKILRIVRRNLTNNSIDLFDLHGNYKLIDAHNSISLGVDRKGFVHICYDHHGSSLKYRRSLDSENINKWTDELIMTGKHEEKVTYPCFIQASKYNVDSQLMIIYRDGSWNNGSARIKFYDEELEQWSDRPSPIISGAGQKPWTSNPYWNHPVRGTDGSLHLSFVWRTDSIGEEALINNINVCYAKSFDNGVTWYTSLEQPYKLPITPVNVETVHPVSPGSNLINQTSMALDSKNNAHIVFYSNDENGIPQYQHVWFNGKSWKHKIISHRANCFNLQGAGTLQIPISRPEILIDKCDNVFVIYRGDLTGNKMQVTKMTPPHYDFNIESIKLLWEINLGYAEPIIDRCRWERDQILTMLLQNNHQPNGDNSVFLKNTVISVVDFLIK